jgi:methyl-accepting chemotaxis protein
MFKFMTRGPSKTEADTHMAECARLRAALDNVQANVMLADTDLRIVYANRSVETMLRAAEADIRRAVPDFRASALVGTSLASLHEDPARRRALLANLASVVDSRLELGGRTYRTVANPLCDAEGRRLGMVVEWTDLTEQLRSEAEIARRAEAESQRAADNLRIRAALDCVSGNVMLADAGNNIVYVNQAVLGMFRASAQDIPRASNTCFRRCAALTRRSSRSGAAPSGSSPTPCSTATANVSAPWSNGSIAPRRSP